MAMSYKPVLDSRVSIRLLQWQPVSTQLLQFLGPRDILHLSCICRSLRSSLRFTAVPSVHLLLLMRQATPLADDDELSVPWGRCYSLHCGRVDVLSPVGFPVPFTWTAPSPLPVGTTVLVHRHTPAAGGTSLNGQTGRVVLWDTVTVAQRYGVKVQGVAEPVRLKGSNLQTQEMPAFICLAST
eukprot:gene9819-1770_t